MPTTTVKPSPIPFQTPDILAIGPKTLSIGHHNVFTLKGFSKNVELSEDEKGELLRDLTCSNILDQWQSIPPPVF